MLDDSNHSEAVMSRDQDFDFRTRLGHYRGQGQRGLVAFAIERATIIAIILIGMASGAQSVPWLWRTLFGN
jgi:hypothetical protein